MKTVGKFLDQSNGFPIDAETFASIQENIEIAAVIGNIVGDKAILYGCELSSDGLTRSGGYVFIRTSAYPNGEILYFEGGDATPYCKVSTEEVNVESEGVSYNGSYITRKLIPYTTARSSYRWDSFILAKDMRKILIEMMNSLTPIGCVQMYASTYIPEGWMLCDGRELSQTEYPELFNLLQDNFGIATTSGFFKLPDLRGRFVVGRSDKSGDYINVGLTGGEEKHTLTEEEMPSHTHSYSYSRSVSLRGNIEGDGFGPENTIGITDPVGGGRPHENRPPYIVLSYIIRVK